VKFLEEMIIFGEGIAKNVEGMIIFGEGIVKKR